MLANRSDWLLLNAGIFFSNDVDRRCVIPCMYNIFCFVDDAHGSTLSCVELPSLLSLCKYIFTYIYIYIYIYIPGICLYIYILIAFKIVLPAVGGSFLRSVFFSCFEPLRLVTTLLFCSLDIARRLSGKLYRIGNADFSHHRNMSYIVHSVIERETRGSGSRAIE